MSVSAGSDSGGESVQGIYVEEEPERINRRYKHASVAVGITKYVVITVFFLFFMVMSLIYSSQISIENFRYIIKDMNLKIPTGIEEYGDIYYVADMEQNYAIYRDDFVCCSRSGLQVIDMTGKQIQNTALKYVKPRLLCSEKYMLVYDLSNTQYSIFNSFSLLHSGTLDYPISGADINDEGYYMIVSRDAEYKSSVTVYNKEMETVYKYQTNDRYIYDATLDNDGSVTLYACSARDGGTYAEIIKGNIRSDQLQTLYQNKDVMPLKAEKSGTSTVSVLCSDVLLFFSGDELVSRYSFYGRSCKRFAAGDGISALVLTSVGAGADSELLIFDTEGTVLYRGQAKSDISGLYCKNKNVYSLYTGGVQRYEINTGKTYSYSSGHEAKGLVFADNEIVLIATSSSAYPVSVYDDFKEVG
ncbi:MAG: hypothetical protein J5879_03640 [Clostridia bacterium]|nr:hypothetical protein [Clostridia bacterium]